MAIHLTPRQQHALESICDTFAPGGDGLPSATHIRVPEALLQFLERNPRAPERQQLATLLSLWDSRLNTLWSRAGFGKFSALSQDRREKILLAWCDSRLPAQRAAFQALKKAALLLYYTLGGKNSARNDSWDRLGYPGPLGSPPHPAPKSISTVHISGDTMLECDVCVVGSGAGGGTAAAVLAAAGLDVVALEAGGYYDEEDFDGAELSGLSRLYWQGGGAATADQGMILLAGECLGGGTIVNYCTSFRTPDDIRAEWAAHGVPQFTAGEFTRSLDAVCERLGVNVDHNRPSKREQLMRRGLEKLGWHVDAMPRNVRGCDQGRICGYCGYGCSIGAKQSTMKTWLADAAAGGARILVETRAERVLIENGEACGVVSRSRGKHTVTVRARAVVVACGSIHTPALLLRSGLGNSNIGRHLHLHPVTAVWGEYGEDVRPWEGTLQALYSDQFRNLTGSYGFKFETTANHPSLAATFLPWRGAGPSTDLIARLRNMFGLGILLRDRDSGRVTVDRGGHPITHYTLSDFDRDHLRIGLRAAAQVHEAAGARRIFSSHSKWVGYEPGHSGSLDQFCRDADACGYGPGQCGLASFHIMGTARMGGSVKNSVCDPEGQTWEVRNLYVADAATFPSSSGVNPMISIGAIAHMNASALAAKL